MTVQISYIDASGERIVLGRLGSFIEAAEAVAYHAEILELQHGKALLVEPVGPIVTEFEDGTVLRYSLEVVDQDDPLLT
ncbi:hypothetical protein [Rhodococcus pyridinivorans]|uniref:hypothetical protein n=1 Tax=Rhodococcus pyridinivorans TaxID=103816 RepID=UPI0037CC8D98